MKTGRQKQAAFTLLEILLAVSIFAIVIASVYASWNGALTGWRRTSEVTDTLQRQRVVLDMLSELTRSAVFFGSDPELYRVNGVHDRLKGDSVSFVTASDALLPPDEILLAGMRRVTIALERDARGGVVLTLANAPALGDSTDETSAPASHVISTEVVGFSAQFLDPRDGTWKDSWDDGLVVPAAIIYSVAFADPTNPKSPPLSITRAVELPAAVGAMQLSGQMQRNQTLTNAVTQQEVPVADPTSIAQRITGGWNVTGLATNRRGVAMLIVLWVIVVLSLLIGGFAFTMHVETQVASFSRKELKAQMLARSGIEVARMQLLLDLQSPSRATFDARNQAWATNDLYFDTQLGDGTFNVKVTDEESKMPINNASTDQLHKLLDLLGVDPSDGDIIVDSVADWIDDDDLHRLNGAESDYYETLSPPYRAKNAQLDRVEELLMIRGVTPEIFYGTPADPKNREDAHPGLKDLVTASPIAQVNVNTASDTVLEAWLGLDEAQIEAVINHRDGSDGLPGTDDDQPFKTLDEFIGFVGGGPQGTQWQQIATVNSSFFTVTSTGNCGGVQRTIIATLRRDGNNVTFVSWREQRGGGA